MAAIGFLCLATAREASAQVPPAPSLMSPEAGSTMYTATPIYTWNEASGATDYTLNVRDANNTILTISYSAAAVCSGSTCTVTPTNTLSNATYYWKVRGTNGSGNGPWSAEASFSAVPPNWNQGLACTGVFLTGDFDGDGRTDRLCSQSGTTNVSLATPTGFTTAAAWLGAVFLRPVVADFNGDGKDDVAEFKPATGIFQVATSTGSAFTTLANWGTATATFNGTHNCKVDPIGTGSGDFDGDGLPDVWCKRNTDGYIFIGRSTGTSFTFSIFDDFTCANGSQVVGAVDIDGDGKSDWYSIAQNDTLCARLSTGTAFTTVPLINLPSTYCAQDKYVFADLNGDGRTDVHCPTNGNVALSTGSNLLDQGTFDPWCNVGSTQVIPGNLDGDGPTELVCNNANAPTNDIEVRKWTGDALDSAQVWLESWCSGQAGTGDFDGDGKTDLLCDQVTVATGGKAGIMPDLMVQSGNGLGGVTLVEYTPSTVFQHVNNPGVKHVVTAQTQQDGRGGSSTWTYTYSGGKIDRQEKQFLGYASTRTNAPCISGEAVCPYGEFLFSQDLASPGALVTSMQRDGAGQLLRKVQHTYTNTSTLPRTSLLTRTDVWEYDSGGGSKQTFSTNQYDAYGNRTQQVSAGGTTASDDLQTDWMYSPNSGAYIVGLVGRAEQRAPGGGVLAAQEYLYDGAGSWSVPPQKGDLTKLRRFLNTTGQYVARTAGFDAYGNQTSSSDETNRTVTTTFDGTDHLFPVSVSNAAGETQGMVWDAACGVVTQSTDPNGQTMSRQYDDLCRLTQTDGPLGAFESRSYHDLGSPTLQRTRIETPAAAGVSGNDWVEDYFDGMGHSYRSLKRGPSSGQDITVDRSYNARGLLESATAPYYAGEPAYATTYEYDALNRRTALERPDGARVETSYAVSSVTQTDENGKATTVQFDDSGHAVLEQRSLNGQTVETASTYDTLGRLVGMTDDVGNQWQWTIDSLGRTIARSDPDAGSWSFEYDGAGRVLSQTDARGQTTSFAYDSVGRLASKTSSAGTATVTWSEPHSGFSNVGRPTTFLSPGTTLQLDYDAAGRTVQETRTLDSVNYVLERRYDAAGRVTGITYPDGDAVGTPGNPWSYDDAGRLASIPGILSSISYDAAGRPTQQGNANGTQTDRAYSAERGFLEQITTSGTGGLQDLAYTHDLAGLVTQVTSSHSNEAWSYGYDDLYRLTSATNLSNPSESQTFEYDTIGRITYNSRVGNYTYPNPGQPRPHAPATVNGNSYSYDANGNRTSGGGQSLVWDAENRLLQAGTAQFAYDTEGERVKKTAPGVVSIYPFGDDYETTNGQVTKYVSAPGLGVVAKRVGGTTYWLHMDRLGSIQAVSDGAGTETLRRTYRPYGGTIAETGSHVESRGWIDQRQDEEVSLTYLHARYYDSTLGVFVSPDPLLPLTPGVGMNRYVYSSGDPVNRSDRSGLAESVDEDGPAKMIMGGLAGSLSSDFGFMVWLAYVEAQSNPDIDQRHAALSSLWISMNETISGAWHGAEVEAARIKSTIAEAEKVVVATVEVTEQFRDFANGTGPDTNYHGPTDPMTQQLMHAPGVEKARSQLTAGGSVKYESRWGLFGGNGFTVPAIGPWGTPLTFIGDDGHFNWPTNISRQFVGGYIVYGSNRDGISYFTIHNTTSFNSLSYHLGPSWDRNDSFPTPGGTTTQFYYWSEPGP